ncbi:MAG: sigma-54-dependent Fis family transcriptional regulator [Rhodospirillaceae bacterium]|nr:sigma-54-dependent Fis family transcriptional regulator [Rhodospirillaceae bacterium]|tara:strand:- start:1312 stop:2724 length:1413 start_codon:yes stop_codon:yes gene_type:complete
MAHDILIVDDEADIRSALSGILEDEGFTVRAAADSQSAEAAIRSRVPSLVILDIWLQESERDGMELLEQFSAEHPETPVIMISGHGNIETAVNAIKVGAYDFIEKPFQADRLLVIVNRAIEAASLRRENEELRQKTKVEDELVGTSGALSQLRATVKRVAPTGSRVLITGPAGAGKEVVARQIHRMSQRANGPFLVINAATMAPGRVEQELFGTERGAMGQDSPRTVGVFERAHGGTLLLDNVTDMPLETQGKILRALQEQTFSRVGGNTPVQVDVRVIATANREIGIEIAEGNFREDLYYRLNVVPIRVPTLTERREDVVLLCQHFIERAADQQGLAVRELSDDAIALLQAADWPGNVRQLRNVIDWLLIMSPSDAGTGITADMLPPEIVSNSAIPRTPGDNTEMMTMPLREAREIFERQYLNSQLMRFGGNISRTATFVGMERSALHRKLKTLGIGDYDRGGDKAGRG